MKRILLFLTVLGLTVSLFAVSAETIRDHVLGALSNHYLNIEQFTVQVTPEGKVSIEGSVETLWDRYNICEKKTLHELISKVKGVREISNQIIVDAPILPDKMIKSNVENELEYNDSIVEPDRVSVNVDNGIVFLDGTVTYHRELNMIETATSWQRGVKGIINNIEVLPAKRAFSDDNLSRVMQSMLDNQFPRQDEVELTVDEGMVTLDGTVTTLWAKNEIEDEFLDLVGITQVENNLEVE